MPDGALEIERYDHGSAAEEWFGHDVAGIYRVAPGALPALHARLQGRTSAGDGEAGTPAAVIQALADRFPNIESLIDWLDKSSGVPFERRYDDWA